MKKSISILLSIVLLLSTFGMLGVSADTPTRDVFDFETDTDTTLADKFYYYEMAAWPYTRTVEETAAISGTKSLKLTYTKAGNGGASDNRSGICLGRFDKSKSYRISGKYKVVSGTLGSLMLVNAGLNYDRATDANLWATAIVAPRRATFVSTATNPGDAVEFSGVISPNAGDGNIFLCVKPTTRAAAGTTVLLDDIVIAEVLDVKATSNDATMGTATVANAANSADTQIAIGEQATFTATANEGYKFTHWQDAAGKKVSTEAVYTCTPQNAMELTACFAAELTLKTFDFEADTDTTLADKFYYFEMAAWPYTRTVEETAAISGTKSLKLTYTKAGNGGASDNRSGICLGLFDKSKSYRISGKYKVVSGTLGSLMLVNVGIAYDRATDSNLWAGISAPRKATFVSTATDPGDAVEFSGVISPNAGDGNIFLCVKPTTRAAAGTTVLLDDITIAEITTVTAASADEAQGKVTVANATDATYTNFAMGEQATFTATAEDGYKFHHWENAAGETVSAEATYTCTITDPVALTAYFAASSASNVFDFEDDTDVSKYPFYHSATYPAELGLETTNPISGNKSLKVTFNAVGANANSVGIMLGKFDKTKTYYVTGKLQVVDGKLGTTKVVNIGVASDSANNNHFLANIPAGRVFTANGVGREEKDVLPFAGTISPSAGDGSISLGLKSANNAKIGSTFLFDDITITEVPKVEAAINNSEAGSTTITNDTDATRTYFLLGDRATFKATANEGYTFSHWEKGGQKVSENATYSCTIMGDTALVAHFTANEAPPPSAVDGAYTIDFETPATGSQAAFEMNTIMEIVSAKGADGQDSKMLHVKPGDHNTDLGSAAQINPTAIKTDADETFSVEVRPVYEYELSFWVKIDSNATYDTTWAKFDVRSGNTAIADSGVTFHDATRGEWKQYKATFTVPAGVEKVSIYANFGSKTPDIYVDNIVLTEKGFNPGTVTEFHSAVDGSYTIDFDTAETGLNTVFQLPDIMSVVDAEGHDGKTSKMLKVKEGNHQVEANTPAHLNAETTKFKKFDTDPTFTVKVREGYAYKFSFRAKIDPAKNSANDTTWSKFYISNNGTDVCNGVQFHTAARGEWKYYATSFTVPAGVDKVSLYANFGSKTPDIYVDEISVTELGKPFAGWNGPQKEYVINFDDFAVALTGVGQEIAPAPARDGKVSNAIRIIPGSHGEAVALNFATTISPSSGKANTDPVFSLPVKENTFYRFSCWIYIPEKQGSFAWHGMYPIYGDTTKNMYNLDDKGVGEWIKLETSFITKAGQNVFSYYYNFGSNPKEIFIDDIIYTEVPAGTLDAVKTTYSAELYNLLDAKALDELIASKKSGAIKVPVAKFSPHTFGITAKGSAKTSISLSLDGTTPLGKSFDTSVDGTIKPTSKEKRYGYEFVTDSSGYIYVIFNNPDGSLEVSDAQIFLSNSRSGGRPMGFEANPNVDPVIGLVEEDASLYGTFTIAGPDAKADTTIDSDLDGDTTAGGTGSVDTDSTSPKTGDKGIALVLLMVSMLSACLVIVSFRKGKVN